MEPGEWVEVRSLEEIIRTLDRGGRTDGLYFMPEMEEFCGQKHRIFKKFDIVRLESTAEVRRLKRPFISLEGVYCSGEHHEGCDRSCYHFWREEWLRQVPDDRAPQASHGTSEGT
jgi:hypothetical protein